MAVAKILPSLSWFQSALLVSYATYHQPAHMKCRINRQGNIAYDSCRRELQSPVTKIYVFFINNEFSAFNPIVS